MADLDISLILSLARALARNLAGQYGVTRPDSPLEHGLTAVLAPAVAAFLGRLSADAPGAEWLPDAATRYFTEPATAAPLARLLAGDRAAQEAAAGAFAALAPAGALPAEALAEALDGFVAAATLAARAGPPRVSLEQDERAAPLHAPFARWPGELPRQVIQGITWFLDGLAANGLSMLAGGQAFAASGPNVVYVWDASGMHDWYGMGPGETMAEPPPEAPPGEGPEEMAEANGGGTAGAEPPDAAAGVGPEELGESGGSAAPPPPAPPPPAPAPSAPAPAPQGRVVALRLDAAAPERVVAGRPFDLAVAIRLPASPPLAPDDLTRRDSAEFGVFWPEGAAFLQMRVQISAPGCAIEGGDSRPVRLLAGADGPTVFFQITPQQAGPISIIITVFQETDWIGSARLKTEAGADEAVGGLTVNVESRPLGAEEVNLQTLRVALDDGYSTDELRDLCFDLDIDYDDLEGGTQSAKARELVLFAKRSGRLAALVERVMKDRAHLLVPG